MNVSGAAGAAAFEKTLKVRTAASLPEAANFPVAGIPDDNKLRSVVSAHSLFRFRPFNDPFFGFHSSKVEPN
jgi:hypothetical protein